MGKARVNFRKCRICSKSNDKDTANPLIGVCHCASYVHYKCQADMMRSKGEIICPNCKTQYNHQIEYSHSRKHLLHYLWEESEGRSNLLKGLSMLVSMFFTLATLWKTYSTDPEGLLEEVASLRLKFTKADLKHNMDVLMILHVKLVLPIVSLYITTGTVRGFVEDYYEWQKTHFKVTIHELKQSPRSAGEKHKKSAHSGKYKRKSKSK